jgi:PKD repeat protein
MVSQLLRVVLNPDNTIGDQKVILGSYTGGACPQPSNSLDCIPSDSTSHSIGTVRSAPDGTLWVGSGDAADFGGVDQLAFRSYKEESLAGKILHVDRDGLGLLGHPFCPTDADLTHTCTKIHSKGLRNPFRFSLRPDGGLVVGDVGWNQREEIDLIRTAGKNYGWPCYEGTTRTPGYRDDPKCSAEYAKEGTSDADVAPQFDYPRSAGGTVIGGPIYAGDQYPAGYHGSVFYGDYAAGVIRRLTLDSQDRVTGTHDFASAWSGGIALEPTPTGDLAYVDIGTFANDGVVREITYTPGNRRPIAAASATPTSGPAPLTVQLDGSRSSDPDGDALTYDWDFGDGSPNSSAQNPTHVYSRVGSFTARLTVSDGRGATATETVRIAPGESPPTVDIRAPADASTYRDGEPVSLSGSASDRQDGPLPASALGWRVTLHHAGHIHPLNTFEGVADTSFTPLRDHTYDAYYEITLTARDSGGLTSSRTVVVTPETVRASIDSIPAGAPLSWGADAFIAPFEQSAAIGFETSVSAAERFISGGRTYVFQRWSNGGPRVQTLQVPDRDFALQATYTLEVLPAGRPPSARPDETRLSFSSEVLPARIIFPTNRSLVYRLHMQAGSRAERFNINIRLPRYGRGRRGARARSPLRELSARVHGPGTASLTRSRRRRSRCARGATGQTTRAKVQLPPHSRTTLELRYRLLLPMRGTDYRLRFRAAGGTLPSEQRVLSPRPTIRGRHGVSVSLSAQPRGRRGRKLGGLVEVRGTARPAPKGRPVALFYRHAPSRRALRASHSRPRWLGRVRLDSRGRFRRLWRPQKAGAYAVFAVVEPSRLIGRSTSCPTRITVAP